jgi:hypothetical protein
VSRYRQQHGRCEKQAGSKQPESNKDAFDLSAGIGRQEASRIHGIHPASDALRTLITLPWHSVKRVSQLCKAELHHGHVHCPSPALSFKATPSFVPWAIGNASSRCLQNHTILNPRLRLNSVAVPRGTQSTPQNQSKKLRLRLASKGLQQLDRRLRPHSEILGDNACAFCRLLFSSHVFGC